MLIHYKKAESFPFKAFENQRQSWNRLISRTTKANCLDWLKIESHARNVRRLENDAVDEQKSS